MAQTKAYIVLEFTEKGKGDDEREHMMFLLSLNRSFVVRDYLQSRVPTDIKFVRYGCGSQVSLQQSDLPGFEDEKRVEIKFDSDMPAAKAAYDKLKTQFNVEAKSGIVENDVMKETISQAISLYFGDSSVRSTITTALADEQPLPEYCEKIPREFWLTTDYVSKGEEDPASFKNSIEELVAKLNKKYGVNVPVNAFFHRDLKKNLE